ncbi:MAG: ComEA family DNA-binding protein [bacterium]
MLDDLNKQQKLIILGLILLIFSGLAVMAYQRNFSGEGGAIVITDVAERDAEMGKEQEQEKEKGRVVVHVTGAVVEEGVYRLRAGARVVDALEVAGGGRSVADLSKINLAQPLKDAERIEVPFKVNAVVSEAVGSLRPGSASQLSKVNINTADEKTLCKIPGVGKTTAKRILDYRTKNGLFAKLEDLMKVKGIGKGTFGKIKDEICR